MKIINPIYDNSFKYLMDNKEVAKIVLSIILDTKVLSLQPKPRETPVMLGNIYLSRFDFMAVIRDEQGEDKAVLIEVQKYKTPDPVTRFRRYLARNYIKEETMITDKGEKPSSLPLISIYILGFDLPEFSCNAIRVDNIPYDITGQKPLSVKSRFVEQLTHQSFILLAVDKPVAEKHNTRLEKFLNMFVQKLAGEEPDPVVDIEAETMEDIELQSVIDHLNKAILDEELIRRVNAEQEYMKGMEDLEIQMEEERRQKEEAKAREKAANIRLYNAIVKRYKSGDKKEDIAEDFAMTVHEINKIIQKCDK